MGPKVSKPKKWLVPNFIFKGWEWCIWTITTIIHHQIWSADSTADITVIQSSKLSTLRSTFGRVPLNFFNCSGWNSFNFYMNFWIDKMQKLPMLKWRPNIKIIQIFWWIPKTLKGLKPKNKGYTNFYENCDFTKKYI